MTAPQKEYIITEEQLQRLYAADLSLGEWKRIPIKIRFRPYTSAEKVLDSEKFKAVMRVVNQYISFGDSPTARMVKEIEEYMQRTLVDAASLAPHIYLVSKYEMNDIRGI